MRSIQNHKTKLQPLFYSHKGDDMDVDNHVSELYDEPAEVTSSSFHQKLPTKFNPTTNSKSTKAQSSHKNKNGLGSDGVLFSAEEDSTNTLKELTKNQLSIKHTLDYFGTNDKKKTLSSTKKSAEKKRDVTVTEQRVFKPILNQNVAPSVTQVDRIPEQSKEESVTTDRIELKPNNNNENNKETITNNDYYNEIKKAPEIENVFLNKENIENQLFQHHHHQGAGRYDNSASVRSSQSIQKKVFNKDRDSLGSQLIENYASCPPVYESQSNKFLRLSGVSDLQQSRDLREIVERKNMPHSANLRILQSTTTLQTETGSRGTLGSEFFGKKHLEHEVYRDVLIDLQSMASDSESGRNYSSAVNISNKQEKATLELIEQRLGRFYADGLFDVYTKSCTSKDSKKKLMTLGKLLLFLKQLDLIDQVVTREAVSIIFSQRCPDKFADFAGFVDVLYKIHKLIDTNIPSITYNETFNKKGYQTAFKYQKFVEFLQAKIFDKQELLNYLDESRSRLNTTESDLYSIDNLSLQILENHHEVLKKTFRSYWPFNAKYQGRKSDTRKGIILQKDFKEFCYDYGLVPTLCTLSEVSELFRRYQKQGDDAIDYKGFIYILCLIANIGFSKGLLKQKFDTFAKRLSKLLSFMAEISQRTPERTNR